MCEETVFRVGVVLVCVRTEETVSPIGVVLACVRTEETFSQRCCAGVCEEMSPP